MFSQINKVLIANKNLIANALGFQLIWFICVQGNNLNAALAAIVLLSTHQLIFKLHLNAWPALMAFSLFGYLGDSAIAKTFQLNYSGHLDSLAPLWLLSLWLGFATTLNHSMQWLFKTPYLTVFIALFIVPISYFAGINLSGSSFNSSFINSSFINSAIINNPVPYWVFFIAEGVWWAILLIGYQKLTASQQVGEVKHV